MQHGIWTYNVQQGSSNFRELRNLVEHVEEAAKDGGLDGAELFLYTDNSTAESAFFNGSSSSQDLDELILRLKKVDAGNEMLLHFIHIAGTRMIALGIDGLSCGSLLEGVMVNPSVLDLVPLHLSAFQRLENDELLNWFRGRLDGSPSKLTTIDSGAVVLGRPGTGAGEQE